jgi:hypothetical protein
MAKRFLATITLLKELGGREYGGSIDNELPDEGTDVTDPDSTTPPEASTKPLPVPPGGAAPSQPIAPGGPSYPVYVPVDEEDDDDPSVSPPIFPAPRPSQLPAYPDGKVYILAKVPGLGWRYLKVDVGNRRDRGDWGHHADNSLPGSDRPDRGQRPQGPSTKPSPQPPQHRPSPPQAGQQPGQQPPPGSGIPPPQPSHQPYPPQTAGGPQQPYPQPQPVPGQPPQTSQQPQPYPQPGVPPQG